MYKYIRNIGLLSLLITIGCSDFKFGNEFLEKPLSNEMNIDSVFSKKIYAEQALAQVYHTLPDFLFHPGRLSEMMIESLTDLSDGAGLYSSGTITSGNDRDFPYNMSYNEEHGEFSATFGIRKAHIFLENIDNVPDMTEDEKTRRKGEAKMIVAYHYVQMFRNLGGMPWIDKAYTLEDDMNVTRMTIEESVEKISGLIDEAASMLPWIAETMDAGRMTKAGALALKSRLLQFAASPLFNNDRPFREGEAADLHYVWWGDKKQSRWQDALDASLAFLRENNGRYKMVDTGEPRKDFYSGFFDRYNGEVLISSHRFTRWDLNTRVLAQFRWGNGAPNLNYANMFPMKDGSDFSWDNPEHNKRPFFDENGKEVRDPRLYETIIVNGDKALGRKAEIYKGGREQSSYVGSGQDWRWGSLSANGIAIRKLAQDQNQELNGKYYQCPLMRMPELYLNIAEAMNELGMATQKDEFGMDAYDYVALVRGRVDMPRLDRTKVSPGEELRKEILRERALEFGYEEVRYYDINRWMLREYLEVPRLRLETEPYEDTNASLSVEKRLFKYKIVPLIEKRNIWVERWDNRYYLSPIPLGEINKKYGLVQNPGW